MVYIIGDLHLSFGVENKSMAIFGNHWYNHYEKIREDWLKKVKEDDTVILAGDFSWAMNLEEALLDFRFLSGLPGKKIMLKGNHDYWWDTVTKMNDFLDKNGIKNIFFLHNNAYEFDNFVIVGTKGWSDDPDLTEKNLKREISRLKLSIDSAENLEKPKIAVFHYPPFIEESNKYYDKDNNFIKTLKDNNIQKCYYAHLHRIFT